MKRLTLLIIAALLVLSLACSFGKSTSPATPEGSSAAEATTGSEASGDNAEATAESPETAEEEGPGDMEELPTLSSKDLEGLDSYRLTLSYRSEMEDGTTEEGSIFIEETRDPQAYRMVIGDQEESMEIIVIGKDQWMNLGGEWMYSQVSEEEMEPFGSGMIFDPDEFFSELTGEDYEYVGKEKINGIQTKHYHIHLDQYADFGDLADVQKGEADIWVAAEHGLPEFPVKLVITVEGENEDGTMTTDTIQMEVTDINTPIKIEPPADAAAGLPGALPEYPNATDIAILGDMYSFHTDDDVATVQAFYEEALDDAGWTKSETTEMEGMVMQTWTKDNESIMLMISADEEQGGSSVIITAGE